ncbi:MAG: family 10 glycosylhydrolase [Bacteroidota bacterium]
MNLFQNFLFRLSILLVFTPYLSSGATINHETDVTGIKEVPNQSRSSEFRAVWIATINNIDWPSNSNLPVEAQKGEFLRLLDTFQKFNLNVVILQVRAASDAFYESKSEPWSHFLTGKQGKAPRPYYDPLAWAIEMCHQRGMELHAWFNPFRVRNLGFYPLDPNSFAAKHPQYVKEFDKKYFLDPGYPEVISHLVEVIAEVATNYDVDAILLDDYFYPYPVDGKKFGDEKSFAKYGRHFYPKRLKEWRRENINHFISSLHDTLVQVNPKIKFGISPFGIWRNISVDPAGSAGLRGMSSYDDLYADVRKWLMNGWIDYVIPQLYWEKGNHFGDFTSLVQWWSENSYGKPLYIGQALYKSTAGKNGWAQPDELTDQINYLRTNQKVRGFAFYSASNIQKLSATQVKALRGNQLNSVAAIDDNRHVPVAAPSAVSTPVVAPSTSAQIEELIRKELIHSLDFNPISIRPELSALPGKITLVKQSDGSRILSLKTDENSISEWYALVSFKSTGKRRYRQIVQEISKSAEFNLSEQKWKELKEMELLLVSRDINNKTDRYSNFFQLKRRRIKTLENPFRHS